MVYVSGKHYHFPARTDWVAKLHPTRERDAIAEQDRIDQAEYDAGYDAAWDEQEALRETYYPTAGSWKYIQWYGW
jgi:hypothetical protein